MLLESRAYLVPLSDSFEDDRDSALVRPSPVAGIRDKVDDRSLGGDCYRSVRSGFAMGCMGSNNTGSRMASTLWFGAHFELGAECPCAHRWVIML
jgi:hypothetical protein